MERGSIFTNLLRRTPDRRTPRGYIYIGSEGSTGKVSGEGASSGTFRSTWGRRRAPRCFKKRAELAWKGDWGPESKLWTRELKLELGVVNRAGVQMSDGRSIFWTPFADPRDRFATLDVLFGARRRRMPRARSDRRVASESSRRELSAAILRSDLALRVSPSACAEDVRRQVDRLDAFCGPARPVRDSRRIFETSRSTPTANARRTRADLKVTYGCVSPRPFRCCPPI